MKKRWISGAAVLLAGMLLLCLFFNNFIKDIPMQLHASQEDIMTISSGDAEVLAVAEGSEAEVMVEAVSEEPDALTEDVDSGSSPFPLTIEEYNAFIASGTKKFSISSYEQFLALQTLCPAAGGYVGSTIIITTPGTDYTWDIPNNCTGFTGIGTSEYPFMGTLYCYYDTGVTIKLNSPMFAYLGDKADVHQLNLVSSNSSAVIADTISGEVNIYDIDLQGTITSAEASEDGAAGIIAARILADSKIILSEIRLGSEGISVTGKNAGGIAGVVGNNSTITLGNNITLGSADTRIQISGTESAGGHFGMVTGTCTWDLTDESKLYTNVVANASAAYAGQYAGKLMSTVDTPANLNIINGTTVTVDVSGTGNGGGLVGFCGSDNNSNVNNVIIAKPEGNFTVTGTVNMTGEYAGGLIGDLGNATAELRNYVMNVDVASSKWAGGAIGRIYGGKYILADITVNNTIKGGAYTGGVIGNVNWNGRASGIVELQGTIDVLNASLSGSGNGYIVGQQVKSLIYTSASEGEINGEKQLKYPVILGDVVSRLLEVATYGGVFRNQVMDGDTMLIGDGTLDNVGVIHNTISKADDGYYMIGETGAIDAAADLETLTIALYTEGFCGITTKDENGVTVSVFEGIDSNTNYADLLSASYRLNSNVDISYDKTGIMSINRHDQVDKDNHAFSGKLVGVDTSITITQNNKLGYWHKGVFATLGGDAEFANLTIQGLSRLGTKVGGLAYSSIGNSLTLTNIHMKKQFAENEQAIGGLLVCENNTTGTFTLNATNVTIETTYRNGLEKTSGFITEMDNAIVNMDTVKLGGTLENTGASSGGFLGYSWADTGGLIKNVSVADGATYTATGTFGGLVHTVSTNNTRLTLDTVNLSGLTVTMSGNDHRYCGLLIQNGQFLVLEVIDYDCSGCVVTGAGKYCDEIVAKTKGNSTLGYTSGIVSIHKRNAEDSTAYCFPDYHYEYQTGMMVDGGNGYSMYFYDVFQRLEADDTTINTVLDTETEVLLWDIMHYAAKGNVWTYFNNNYWGDAKYSNYSELSWESENRFTFAGELNLSDISFYPVTRVGGVYNCNNAVISFNAAQMDEWQDIRQHDFLSAGLFMNAGHLSIRELTLTGNIANEGASSGALACGSEGMENGYLYRITLNDLWINGYSKTQSQPGAGLLISNIPGVEYKDTEVELEDNDETTFDQIIMKGYEDDGENKAAAALIGSAGGENVYNVVLKFKYMNVADDRDDRTVGSHNGKVLAYASFLYNYNYTNDAKINTGNGLYLFSENDYKSDYVTFGEELDYDTEFSDNSKTVFESTDPDPSTLYKPYVYQVKDIEVNPKSGDILKGCGTYEDPYIIETAKQFLTLYRYMNETGTVGNYQYDTFYDGWQVIKIGDDSTFCTAKHSVTEKSDGSFSGNGAEEVVTYNAGGTNENFPTPDEMSRAYYQLGADIDLSVKMSTTFAQIAQDFVGFGVVNEKVNRPFVGVWYGKDATGTIHTITLPNKTVTDPYATYGFIQYAKGAVVKDMIIKTVEQDEDDATNIRAQISDMGGGVIACILGGDNIIDNVTVAVEYKVADANATIGGYVGTVQKGGLILRNVSEGSAATEDTTLEDGTVIAGTPAVPGSLSGFSLDQLPDQSVTDTEKKITWIEYEHLGAVVGKVEDGYVLYEGSTEDGMLWSGKGGNTSYSQVPNYNILNGTNLKNTGNGLTVSMSTNAEDSSIENITISIPNAAALQIMSMALNSDSLNIRPSDYDKYTVCGYTELSRSRKAKYDAIGSASESQEDYVFAAKYDNVMDYQADGCTTANLAYAYPYLYQYMGITDDSFADYLEEVSKADGTSQGYSVLNSAVVIDNTNYIAQWNLVGSDIVYDMSVFENGFRGLGALYQTGVEYGGCFHGNFDGMNNTIHVAMNKKLMGDDKANTAVTKVGFFNVLYARATALYKTEVDFKDIDATTSNLLKAAEIKNFTMTGQIAVSRDGKGSDCVVGGVVATIAAGDARFLFENITVKEYMIKDAVSQNGMSNVGGIIGELWAKNNVMIRNCSIQGKAGTDVSIKGRNSVGGLVGYTKAAVLKIVTSEAQYIDVQSASEYAGGFVGYSQWDGTRVIVEGTSTSPCIVSNSKIKANQMAGGIIGRAQHNSSMTHIKIEKLTIGSFLHMGGVIGYAESSRTTYIRNVVVTDIITDEVNLCNTITSGIGGIVGRNNHKLTIENATVQGTVTNGGYNCRIHASNKNRTGSNGTGGIVGVQASDVLKLKDCNVEQISVSTAMNSAGYVISASAGGIVGHINSQIILDGSISVTNSKISAEKRSETDQEKSVAGGCFGFIEGPSSASFDYIIRGAETGGAYSGLTATNNTVTGKQAGGLIGYVSKNNTGVRLTGIQVTNGIVTSDEYAGGVYGYICPGFKGTVLEKTATNTISNMQIAGRIAGGVIGELHIEGDMRMETIELRDNTITAKQYITGDIYSAGGVIGNCCGLHTNPFRMYNVELYDNTIACETAATTSSDGEAVSLLEAEEDMLASGGLIGRTRQSTSASIAEIECDNIVIDASNKIGVKQAGTADVMLVTYDSANDVYKLAVPAVTVPTEDEEYKHYEVFQDLTEDYGYYVGNFVGVWDSDQLELYVLRSNAARPKFIPPALTTNPPVTDVGRSSAQTADAYRSRCHIIYGATVTAAATAYSTDANVGTNLKDMKMQVDAVNTVYANEDLLSEILQEYRLSEQAVEWFGKLYQDSFTFSEGKTIDFPVLVYKAEYGTLQEIMECITDVMTNVAGASASDLPGAYLSITCKQMLCDGTTVTEGNGTASITATITDGITTYSSSCYDGLVEDKVSYTEITFVYGWSGHQKTFRLPIFVEEPILYGVHSMLIEGKVTDVETIKSQGVREQNSAIIMANDSDYTMLLEYTYGKARKNMPDNSYVDKVFYLTDTNGTKKLAVGTKLMLIDVSNGNKAYYYIVESEDIAQVKFTDFKDSAGNAYVNKSIDEKSLPDKVDDGLAEGEAYFTDLAGHQLEETGVESFLLTVLAPDTAGSTNEVYTINAGIQIEDAGLASRFDNLESHEEQTSFVVKSIPGITIKFTDDTTTDIIGSISKEEGLTVKAGIEIRAKDEDGIYWVEKGKGMDVIDSSNNGKYLDIAFYLRDTNGNRVNLPTGTNFSYKTAEGMGSENKVIANNAIFYYYKDIRDVFEKEDSVYEIGDVSKNTIVYVEFYLDFSGADFSNISEEKYNAWLDLLRTSNKDYPMGSDNKVDDYTEEVEANATQQMGFSIRAYDLYQLAINTYPKAAEQNTIDYNVMFDFSDILKQTSGAGEDALTKKWSGFDYTVTYQIYEKTGNDVANPYEVYDGNDIVLTVMGAENGNGELGEVISSNGTATALYRFTENELSANQGFITLPGKVTISTEALTADLTALTNYKVEATLTITERGSTTQPAEQTIDFFIYTITKLKTDI